MRKTIGEPAIDMRLTGIDDQRFDTRILKGKRYMLSFFRFASCPFCHMRMHQLVGCYAELGDDFEIVAVFDSPLKNLQSNIEKHHVSPFAVLADQDKHYYQVYGIEYSWLGVFKGMFTRIFD
ncbi:MAG: redoxin domain-containing protein [Mariprofundaceae bacterium]|nr:redoxin domain-containing protein [Mariprofundaceae bacterium]